MTRRIAFFVAVGALALIAANAHAQYATLPALADEAELAQLVEYWRGEYRKEIEVRRRFIQERRREWEARVPDRPFQPPILDPIKPMGYGFRDPLTAELQARGADFPAVVKPHGDHLVILKEGRLYTVAIGGNRLAAVSSLEAYGDGLRTEFDYGAKLLVWRDTVAVVRPRFRLDGPGYPVEIALFDISVQGILAYRATYHLRANYYAPDGFAVRLVGAKLVFYFQNLISIASASNDLPAMRRWRGSRETSPWIRTAPALRIHRVRQPQQHRVRRELRAAYRRSTASRRVRCGSAACPTNACRGCTGEMDT